MHGSVASEVKVAHRAGLSVVVLVAAILAVMLHRSGHTQGDDFALYLRQARSLFDGDPAAVIADNRFAVVNSDDSFSPIGYPWGWPLLLSPFVHFWEFDYDRLKLVVVASLCVFLVVFHGIVRRRIGRVPAIAIVAAIGTAPAFLAHTEQLLTEFPHLAAVAVVIWWSDRIRRRSSLGAAPTVDLIVLGVLVTAAFSMRREGLVLLAVIAAMQLFDLIADDRGRHRVRERLRSVIDGVTRSWGILLVPYVAFAGSAALFQLLLPTAVLPDNGNSPGFIDDRLGEYPRILSDQLGLGERPVIGLVVLSTAVVGAAIGLRRRPRLDGPLLVLACLSALAISTHLRKVDRYWFQVTPWVVYFATVAVVAIAGLLFASRPRVKGGLIVAPLAVLLVAHAVVLPGRISDVRDFESSGRVLSGPTNPAVQPVYEAVQELTPPDAVIAFFRARTMTLLTERRSFQTYGIDRIELGADYFAQRRDSTFWQPSVDAARERGFEEIWSDQEWILWRVNGAIERNDRST